MKRNNNRVLNYYLQLINRKKIEVSQKEKDFLDLVFLQAHLIYYQKRFPSDKSMNQLNVIIQSLLNLYEELFALQDKYFDLKGKDGLLYVN